MSTPNDGGPAFPVVFDHNDCTSEHPGMSLRDWFAGMALTGMQANPEAAGNERDFAHYAYVQADAMLAQREKREVKS